MTRPRLPDSIRPVLLTLGRLLALLVSSIAAAAEPLTLDPPAPNARLPQLELRAPLRSSAAADSWPALSAAHARGRLDEARTLAEAAVAACRSRDGDSARSALDARLNRAIVLLNGGDLGIAGEQFTRLIDDASASEGLRAPQLEDAWYGLGLTTLAAGNAADAERAFAAALQAHRVERGLHAPGQLGYLDAMALTAAQRGRLDLADGYQLRRIELIERLHDDRSIERADAAKVLADWYERTERPREALQAHMYRVDVLERGVGNDDARRVAALLDAARAYALVVDRYRERPFSVQLRNGSVVQTTEPPLATALRILKKSDVRLPPGERGQLLLRIGEVHWIQGDRRRALTAWKAAADTDPATADRLARPEAIEWPADWPTPAGLGAGGTLELRFVITDRGRVKDARQTVLTPAGDANGTALASALRKGLNQVRFRPALRAGDFIDAVEMRYQHPFQPAS